MHYVYVLRSLKSNELYTGCTMDLKKRFREHADGLVFATKAYRPYVLIHYEMFLSKKDAFAREKWLKTGWGRNQIQKMLENYLGT